MPILGSMEISYFFEDSPLLVQRAEPKHPFPSEERSLGDRRAPSAFAHERWLHRGRRDAACRCDLCMSVELTSPSTSQHNQLIYSLSVPVKQGPCLISYTISTANPTCPPTTVPLLEQTMKILDFGLGSRSVPLLREHFACGSCLRQGC